MQSNRIVFRLVFIFSIAIYFIHSAKAFSLNGTLLVGPHRSDGRFGKYSIDDLINSKFPVKVSDDIDMDPSKWSKLFIFRISLSVNVE